MRVRMSSFSEILRLLMLATAVASAGGSTAQTVEPQYDAEFLQRGFGVLKDRVLEGAVVGTKQNVSTLGECVDLCRSDLNCRSFTYTSQVKKCEFKSNNTFFPREISEFNSGITSGISIASRDLDIQKDKIVKSTYEYVNTVNITSPQDACAKICQDSADVTGGGKRCRAFSANFLPQSNRVVQCRLSESDELSDADAANKIVSARSKHALSDFVISDMRITVGGVIASINKIRDNPVTFLDCVNICKENDKCSSFVFRPSVGVCEIKDGSKFSSESRIFDVVSGIKNDLSRRVQAVYLVPSAKAARPGAEMAITEALKAVQEHFGKELGRTFVIDTPAVSTLIYNGSFDQIQAGDHNSAISSQETNIHKFALSTLEHSYGNLNNIVIFVAEGLPGTSYGTSGVVIISGGFWNDLYGTYISGKDIKYSQNLVTWTHELGHAFGLLHLGDLKTCLNNSKVNVEQLLGILPDESAIVMSESPSATPVFQNHFSDWEKKRLLGENIGVGSSCSFRNPNTTMRNIRPPSESYLRLLWPPAQ